MLYVTTRDSKDAFTAHRALHEDLAPDGGRFVPFRLPVFTTEEIASLKQKTFGQAVAELLNIFFSCQLTGWDVDFCIGRNAARLAPINHKIIIAELWHNPSANYNYVVNSLYRKVTNSTRSIAPADWFCIAVRISVLFGLYSEILKAEMIAPDQTIDISVSVGDFSAAMAAWYARSMGLPIGMIICTCEEYSPVWDLIHRGIFNTTAVNGDVCLGVERLVQASFGFDAAREYCKKCDLKQTYIVNENFQDVLLSNIFCTVAGVKRSDSTINSIFRSNSYIVDPGTALCFGGLQDYRARTGANRLTLLLAERTPLDYTSQISGATGIPETKLIDYIKLS